METKRLILATILSALVLIGFDYFFPQAYMPPSTQDKSKTAQTVHHNEQKMPSLQPKAVPKIVEENLPDKRIAVNGPAVRGTINLRGALLDDLQLTQYRETVQPGSPNVRLLSSKKSKEPNYIDFGWRIAGDTDYIPRLPTSQTLWNADRAELDPEHPVTLSWDNGAGQVFKIHVAVDKNFMFTVTQSVEAKSGQHFALYPYYRVNRGYTPQASGNMLVHEGPISVIDSRLDETSYKDVRKAGIPPDNVSWVHKGQGGWAGITDKYWLMAVVPDQKDNVIGSYAYQPEHSVYQVGFSTTTPMVFGNGGQNASQTHLFVGAKKVHLLEAYEQKYHIPMFWKAVDFGHLSFLTRPVFSILDWLSVHMGSFWVALLTFTVIVKTVFLPLTMKQMRMTYKMIRLRPQMDLIRSRYKDDPVAMQQNIMQLYRKEHANPFSGFLPLLIQAPVFWCLYKDLYVTIEMRHTPFFGWIKDLSSPDPTNIFNLFGLIPFDPTHISSILDFGIWPIIYCGTMFLMQKLSPAPAPAEPMQRKMMLFFPVFITCFMAHQPVGLVIYYVWSNILTAIQQFFILHHLENVDKKPQMVKNKPSKKK